MNEVSGTSQAEKVVSSILIVDDHETNRFILKKILSELKLNVIEASSGEQAIELLHDHKVFMILMDVNMPGMSGIETAVEMRAVERFAAIPIIFITGHEKEDFSVQSGYESGAVDYLLKPVDPKALISKVKVFYELHQKTQQLEVQHQKIVEQQQALEKSYEQLKKFTHTVAHDLKNPVSTMIASIELLEMEGTGGEEEEIVSMHQETGYRLLKLIDQLLLTASGANEVTLAPVSLLDVVKNVLSDLDLQIKHRNAEVTVDQLPSINGSETHLYQVFQNIISNALKYSKPEVTPVIEVKSKLLDEGEPKIKLDISDNGQGFDPVQSEKLFEAYERLTEGGEGRGIGMATVKQIVVDHGGKISATSELGKGSVFTIELPIGNLEAEE